MHSLCSAQGYTDLIATSNPLHASELMASCGMHMHLLRHSRNQVQFLVVSAWKNPNATGNIQLCPSIPVADGRHPFHRPLSVVLSMLKYGRHPFKKPSIQGLKQQKNL